MTWLVKLVVWNAPLVGLVYLVGESWQAWASVFAANLLGFVEGLVRA